MTDTESQHAVDEIELSDIGARLIELGEQLQRIGTHTQNEIVPDDNSAYVEEIGGETLDNVKLRADAQAAMKRTFTGLRRHRRAYSHWERLAVEFALKHLHFTQREVAKDLGVGLSTINRWAQNPLDPATDD